MIQGLIELVELLKGNGYINMTSRGFRVLLTKRHKPDLKSFLLVLYSLLEFALPFKDHTYISEAQSSVSMPVTKCLHANLQCSGMVLQ